MDIGEAPEVTCEIWRTARKQHTCCACGDTIRAGDRYHYTSGVWSGEADSYKHCARCWAAFEILRSEAIPGDNVMPLMDLGCGHTYDGDDPRMYELAFMTADEAQSFAPCKESRE